MRQPRPLNQEERSRREAEARRQVELAHLEELRLAQDKYETVLHNLFEMLQDNFPTLRLDRLSPSLEDQNYVIQLTAKTLLRYDGKLNEKNLENSHYLNKLAYRLLSNMIGNYVLNQHELENEDPKQKKEIQDFETTLQPFRKNKSLQPEASGLLDLFIEGFNEAFKENTPQDLRSPQQQNKIGHSLDKMKDSLYELEKINPELSDEITKLTHDFFKRMEKLGEEAAQEREWELGREIADTCSAVFKELSKLVPRSRSQGGSTPPNEEEKRKAAQERAQEQGLDPLNKNSALEERVVDYISGGRVVTMLNHLGQPQNVHFGQLFPPIFDSEAGPDLKDKLVSKPLMAPTPFRTNPNPFGE